MIRVTKKKDDLDSLGLYAITEQLDDKTLFHFMLWLKRENGIGNIRDLPISLLLKFLAKFEKWFKKYE